MNSIKLERERVDFNNLSKDHLAAMYEERDLARKIAYSTEPLDPAKVANAINSLYKLQDETPPPVENIYIEDGPVHAWNRVCYEYGKIFNSTEEEIKEFKKNFILTNCSGNFAAGYIFFSRWINSLGYDLPQNFDDWMATLDLHWTWTFPNSAVVCQRPIILKMQGNVLHCEDGPAIQYADGTMGYAIEGLMLDEKIVMRPHQITFEEIEKQTNNDVKSIMIERYGWDKFLEKIGAVLIDERENLIQGTRECLFATKKYGKRFVATCPTGPIVCLGVLDDFTTCEQAQRWLDNNVDGKQICLGRA